jgi:hypothetical protein
VDASKVIKASPSRLGGFQTEASGSPRPCPVWRRLRCQGVTKASAGHRTCGRRQCAREREGVARGRETRTPESERGRESCARERSAGGNCVAHPMFSDRIIEASRMTTDQTTNRD